jgi:putative SOS response-associated peptidase YedK
MPVDPDAMPVLLMDQVQHDQWMNAPWEVARELQKPPPTGTLKVARRDAKEDADTINDNGYNG